MNDKDGRRDLVTALDSVTYGVEDLALGTRFFTDWGLTRLPSGADRALFETLEGSRIELRARDAPDLPPAIEPGSTVREVTWSVRCEDDLRALQHRLQTAVEATLGADGVLRCRDPGGLGLAFRVSGRRQVHVVGSAVNGYGRTLRVDAPSPIYQAARPVRLSHVVFNIVDFERIGAFYTDVVGFHLSDSYPGNGMFLRCQIEGGHHDLFLSRSRIGKAGLNHVSFMVRDIYEAFGGGINMNRLGWETEIGPGRHPISSAVFWYIRNPCGALAEYYADEDYLTAAWKPREFERTRENFAEWSIAEGIDPTTRQQRRP
ncbi:MAG: VOC family protein [Steroidobacteraceae bacterium]